MDALPFHLRCRKQNGSSLVVFSGWIPRSRITRWKEMNIFKPLIDISKMPSSNVLYSFLLPPAVKQVHCKSVSWLWPSSQATNVAWNSVACYWFNHILTLSQGKHPRPIRGCLRPQSQLYAYLTTLPTSNGCLPSVPDFLVLPLEKSMMDKGGSLKTTVTGSREQQKCNSPPRSTSPPFRGNLLW